jgi:hypothetical protein
MMLQLPLLQAMPTHGEAAILQRNTTDQCRVCAARVGRVSPAIRRASPVVTGQVLDRELCDDLRMECAQLVRTHWSLLLIGLPENKAMQTGG